MLAAFYAALAAACYQEVRWRRVLNALPAALAALAALHLFVAVPAPGLPGAAMFAAVAAGMLGILRLGGAFRMADWACTAALFAALLPMGAHVPVLSLLAGLASSCAHAVIECSSSNLAGRIRRGGGRGPAPLFSDLAPSPPWTRAVAAVACRRRRPSEAAAYPAVTRGGGPPRLDVYGGMRGKRALAGRGDRPEVTYVVPSVPVLAHSCAASLAVMAVFGA